LQIEILNCMKLSYSTYHLQLQHTFTVSGFSRDTSPIVLTQITYEGLIGYGEASMPPYLGETQESVVSFLKRVDLSKFTNPLQIEEILQYVESIAPNNRAAKASIDIALHDLMGKIVNKPLYEIWGINPKKTPFTSYTIGIDKAEIIKEKTKEASSYQVLKVKLGSTHDKEIINSIRSITQVPLYVDANQGWKDKHQALDKIHWLHERGIKLIEQPMPKEQIEDMAWLTEHSPIPTIADESFQRLADVQKLKGIYTGINIKLMKSTGLHEAKNLIYDMKNQEIGRLLQLRLNTASAIVEAALARTESLGSHYIES